LIFGGPSDLLEFDLNFRQKNQQRKFPNIRLHQGILSSGWFGIKRGSGRKWRIQKREYRIEQRMKNKE
jgi:hypothetical protein